MFVNDFMVSAYGASTLLYKDVTILGTSGDAHVDEGAKTIKLVIGPGTGLGVGVLSKNKSGDLYQPMPSEGGHVDFAI